MADPHNKKRYGETWDQSRIDSYLEELEHLRANVIISGGWAWHFMSPDGHTEYKHAHDHKDIDLFCIPEHTGIVIGRLKANGFKKVSTRYDKPDKRFIRYEKNKNDHKITIDMFFETVPFNVVKGWKIIDPDYLLSLYKSVHSSDNCWAVLAAAKLSSDGEEIINNEKLVKIPV